MWKWLIMKYTDEMISTIVAVFDFIFWVVYLTK